jgi:hypothetical protein
MFQRDICWAHAHHAAALANILSEGAAFSPMDGQFPQQAAGKRGMRS